MDEVNIQCGSKKLLVRNYKKFGAGLRFLVENHVSMVFVALEAKTQQVVVPNKWLLAIGMRV